MRSMFVPKRICRPSGQAWTASSRMATINPARTYEDLPRPLAGAGIGGAVPGYELVEDLRELVQAVQVGPG